MIKKIFLTVVFCTVSVFTMAQSQTVTHVVQRGETIESIAEIYKVSVRDINKANPWRKRSIPTHSEWLYPLTFDAGKGLKEA